MLTLQIFFIKFFQIFFYNKFSTLIAAIVTLNKIKLNLLILSVLYLAILPSLQTTKYIQLLITTVYSVNVRYCNFLQTFLFGLFKIHPPLFYVSLIMHIPAIHTIQNGLKCRNINLLSISIISLILGSTWALYQLNWGSYWSSDPIEFALLFIIIIYIQSIHTFKLKTHFKLWTVYSVLIYIQLIRSSLIYTKHNFFSNSSNIYIYLKTITLTLLFYLLTCKTSRPNTYMSQIKIFFTLNTMLLILFGNLSYNNYIKKTLTNVTYTAIIYTIFQIEWNLIKHWFIHASVINIILTFIIFKLHYTYILYVKNSLKEWICFKFYKSQTTIWFKYRLRSIMINNTKHTKGENVINILNHNFFFIKKKLINYFI